jgi:hypothetical protein
MDSSHKNKPHETNRLVHHTVCELVDRLVVESDEMKKLHIENMLLSRDLHEVLLAAQRLLGAGSSRARSVGVSLLGMIGNSGEAHAKTVAKNMLTMLRTENDRAVLQQICLTFGRLALRDDDRLISMLVRRLKPLASDPTVHIREVLAISLGIHHPPCALRTIILLSTDIHRDVRDWATFALAERAEDDYPAVRSALIARLEDKDYEVRAEALRGLANGRDPLYERFILAELKRGHRGH